MTVLYFGIARDCAGVQREEIGLPGAIGLSGLWSLLLERHPCLETVRGISRVAVGMQYASDSDMIADNAEVAIIPPVAGG